MSVRALEAAEVLTLTVARDLHKAGLAWRPTAGDRFVLADRDMDAEVFVVSDMVADVHEFPSGPVIGFNGTVEWALDSVGTEQAVWLPAEDQLRRLLAGTFRRLEQDGGSWSVTVRLPGDEDETSTTGGTAGEAYAAAVLLLLRRALD